MHRETINFVKLCIS